MDIVKYFESEERYYKEQVERLRKSGDPESEGALKVFENKLAEVQLVRKEAIIA